MHAWMLKEEPMVGQAEEIQAAVTLEKRAQRIIQAALSDKKFMDDVREAQQLEAAGDRGEPWAEVKKRLRLV
jgi:hypothetical protein